MDPRTLFSVATGGVAGAALRWASGEVITNGLISLVVVNATGAFVLGLLVQHHRAHPTRPHLWLGVGFCGGLTTFSTLAVEAASRLERGDLTDGLATVALTVGTGLLAAVLGNRAGQPLARRRT